MFLTLSDGEKAFIRESLNKKIWMDGRNLQDFREIEFS